MKRQLFLLGIMIMGVLVMTTAPVLAADAVYETKFAPYFIGRQQRDNLIVVNHSKDYHLSVVAMAYDPFTGKRLDSQEARILVGEGARIVITHTHPEPHASQLVVEVTVISDGIAVFIEEDELGADVMPDPPFSITRVLTTRQDATVLQIKGGPILINANGN